MLLQVVCTSHGFPSSSTSINRGGEGGGGGGGGGGSSIQRLCLFHISYRMDNPKMLDTCKSGGRVVRMDNP
jgi:uncharacterized spore protein YtfJ